MADVVKSMSHAMARAMEEDTPRCMPINISSGEDALTKEEIEWAWQQHMADNSPHRAIEVQ